MSCSENPVCVKVYGIFYMMYPFNENMQQAFFQSGGNLFFLFHPLYGKDI
ncbi:hypothetical protein HMPREF9008_01732 [Parabacteroides sp. 20_3]|uniref:Uncharacterized protein n=1 Tax=Phocaeicola dorei DSM 17855 TaxID=483217 RepID=B6W585_9BACT|nr:hypothetical protein BACDOR_04736 [Phocaeicola dorei DSM 17855]EFK64624.1 hypothetical protein HMPREF9008_01732 [Parabacteroides sp. 20_3]